MIYSARWPGHSFSPAQAIKRVSSAVTQLRNGDPIVLVDSLSPQQEGDLVFAAELATAKLVAFAVQHTSGFVCVALPTQRCEQLRLPPMYAHSDNDSWHGACRVTVDAVSCLTTGISAADRAITIRSLADVSLSHTAFTRPGHVVPIQANSTDRLIEGGIPEAVMRMVELAGLNQAAGFARIVSTIAPTRMATKAELFVFARRHRLACVTTAELAYREFNGGADHCFPPPTQSLAINL